MTPVQLRDLVAATLWAPPGREYRRVSLPYPMRGETFFLLDIRHQGANVSLDALEALADALLIDSEDISLSSALVFPSGTPADLNIPIYVRYSAFDLWETDRLARHLHDELGRNLYLSSMHINQDGVPYSGPMSMGQPYPVDEDRLQGAMLLLRVSVDLLEDE